MNLDFLESRSPGASQQSQSSIASFATRLAFLWRDSSAPGIPVATSPGCIGLPLARKSLSLSTLSLLLGSRWRINPLWVRVGLLPLLFGALSSAGTDDRSVKYRTYTTIHKKTRTTGARVAGSD